MKNYKVCIPTAGTGSRVSEFTSGLNKSLLEINNKPVISYIINSFPKKLHLLFQLALEQKH